MADAINTSTDGQSIPSALAATPASRKPRAKAGKPAKPAPVPAPVIVDSQHAHPLAALVEAEAVIEAETAIEAEAPAPVAEIAADSPESSPVAKPEAPEAEAPEPEAPQAGIEAATPEPVPVFTPTAAVPAQPKKESIMATTIDNVTNQTAKAQAFFTDANVRTKDAMAKSAKMFEEAGAFGKGNVEALVESSKIAAKAFETMGQDAAEFGRKQLEEATAAFKTLATVKSPTEFMKLQGDFMRQSFDALVAETSRSTEQALKLAGEVAQPISNRLSLAAEKIKTAA